MDRSAIKKTGLSFGIGLSLATSSSVFQSCIDSEPTDSWQPKFLKAEDVDLVDGVVNILIPDEEVPAKVRAAIPKYVDAILTDYSPAEAREKFSDGLNLFNASCTDMHMKEFIACDKEQKISFLKKEEEAFVQATEPTFFGDLKKMVFEAFFQTEIGVKQFLSFNPTVDQFAGCIPFEEVGKIQYSSNSFSL